MNTLNILSCISIIPVLSGTIATLCCGFHSKKTKIPGLLFHSVLPHPKLNLSHFSLKKFRCCSKKIKKLKITPITVNEAANDKYHSSPNQYCLLTFDDGLENIFHNAIPCLDEHDFKASIFCVAGFTGKQSTWDVYKESKHLSATQIRQLSDNGHEIGSHTLTHANLPYLDSKDLIIELRDSKRILEDITGKQINSISFPHGSWNERVWNCALEQGYQSATLYRSHHCAQEGMFPVIGAGRFDSVNDIIKKLNLSSFFSPAIASSKIAAHFAKGTPVWKFRRNYRVFSF